MPNFEEYFPFDPGFGASANAARWRKMANLWCPDGVVANYPYGAALTASQLYATLTAGTATIQPGAVFIHGYYAEISTPQSITGIGTNGTIVAQVNFNTEVVQLFYRDGVVDYGSNPSSNYQQDANIWEIPIWLVSGGVLVDIRNLVNPATGLRWSAQASVAQPVASAGTLQASIGVARIPYAAQGFLQGTLLLTFSDLSVAQSAACSLTYQSGQPDAQSSPTIQPAISGGGPAGQAISIPVSLTGSIPVTKGKKTYGWRVTAGTGPAIQVAQMTLSLWSGGIPAAN